MTPPKIYQKLALKRLQFSFFIVFLYLLGSKIVLPGLSIEKLKAAFDLSSNLSFAMSMTGMTLDTFSLFSIGLGPWMSAMILWQIVGVTKLFKTQNLTWKQSYQIQFLLSLVISGIQSLMIISLIKPIEGVPSMGKLMVFLVTGSAILVWLGNLNRQFGIGGPTIIVLVSIIRGMIGRSMEGFNLYSHSIGALFLIFSFLIFLIWGSFYVFRFFQGERRLPLMHVMLDNKILSQSYFPVPVNPAGGMPFMYSFSIVLFPQYLLIALLYFQPGNQLMETLYERLRLSEVPGVLFLMLCVLLLNYGFSYVNVDYKEISENLQKSGDYFNHVYPGRNTEKFLCDLLTRMATVSGIINIFVIGLPMMGAIFFPSLSTWAYVIPSWMILITMMDKIRIEFLAIYRRNNYQPLL